MFMKSIIGKPAHVALTTGHSIVVPVEGCDVPPAFVSDALKSGKVAAVEQVKVSAAAAPGSNDAGGAQGGKVERIKSAIKGALDAGDESFMTDKGIPDARKLDKLVGEPVSAAERDQAWAELQAEAAGE